MRLNNVDVAIALTFSDVLFAPCLPSEGGVNVQHLMYAMTVSIPTWHLQFGAYAINAPQACKCC